MFIPAPFQVPDAEVHRMLQDATLAYLVTPGERGMHVTPLPVSYDAERNSLTGHVSRSNPHWRDPDHHEARRQHPWSVGDAPESFVDRKLRAIVGVELVITRWEGKAKMSQNQPEANRRSVIAGLAASAESADQQLVRRIIARSAE